MINVGTAINNTFRVIGRYKTGSAVTAYQLIGTDGSQMQVTKDRLVYMIGKGLVENVRVQANGSELIIRGNGINLNKLPVYNLREQRMQNNDTGSNTMVQLEIKKRIMYKTACKGYIVADCTGKEYKLSRKRVIELAIQKLISNADVKKYKSNKDGKTRLILRGNKCDLANLPVLLIDDKGNLIDPAKDKEKVIIRVTRMRKGGLLLGGKDLKVPFNRGDFLVFNARGQVKVYKGTDLASRLGQVKDSVAICDNYVDNVSKYQIEIFGSKAIQLKPEQILKWNTAIIK